MKIKKIIKKLLPYRLLSILREYKANLADVYSIKSYSQEGEDTILMRIFEKKEKGFYVDVGAHHPKKN